MGLLKMETNKFFEKLDKNGLLSSALLFREQIALNLPASDVWRSLQLLYENTVGCRLFTVMTADMKKLVAQRIYTSHPFDYPVSGTKPIHLDYWFDVVHRQQRLFVANTIADIAKVFPDHEKIWAMGCGSVVNVPVIVDGVLVATINILDVENHYTPERIEVIEHHLGLLSFEAYQAAHRKI